MKTSYLILLTCIPFYLSAQQTALFETTIWFTDAMGNTDSVIVGYDPDAKWDTLNPQFGEVLIDAPFDSVFEVRASWHNGWGWAPKKYFTKKKITRARKVAWVPDPCLGIFGLGIHIYARHYPVTVTWDREVFQTECRTRTYIASHTTDGHIQYWYTEIPNIMDYTQCMAVDSAYIIKSVDDSWEWYNRYPTMLTNDSAALISVLNFRFLDKSWWDTPCPAIVSVEPAINGYSIQVFPNPASGEVRIALSGSDLISGDLQVRLYSTGLQVAGIYIWQASSPYLDIPISDVPAGVYIVEIRDQRGIVVDVQKLIVK